MYTGNQYNIVYQVHFNKKVHLKNSLNIFILSTDEKLAKKHNGRNKKDRRFQQSIFLLTSYHLKYLSFCPFSVTKRIVLVKGIFLTLSYNYLALHFSLFTLGFSIVTEPLSRWYLEIHAVIFQKHTKASILLSQWLEDYYRQWAARGQGCSAFAIYWTFSISQGIVPNPIWMTHKINHTIYINQYCFHNYSNIEVFIRNYTYCFSNYRRASQRRGKHKQNVIIPKLLNYLTMKSLCFVVHLIITNVLSTQI